MTEREKSLKKEIKGYIEEIEKNEKDIEWQINILKMLSEKIKNCTNIYEEKVYLKYYKKYQKKYKKSKRKILWYDYLIKDANKKIENLPTKDELIKKKIWIIFYVNFFMMSFAIKSNIMTLFQDKKIIFDTITVFYIIFILIAILWLTRITIDYFKFKKGKIDYDQFNYTLFISSAYSFAVLVSIEYSLLTVLIIFMLDNFENVSEEIEDNEKEKGD